MKTSKQLLLASMVVSITSFGSMNTANAQQQLPVKDRYVSHYGGNPYIPLWEHLPDGEPRVFEDPDQPGKYRAYIIGSHDVNYSAYCGPDIRMWSAPVEDLTKWRDEGPIFSWYVDGQWDTMFAPDLVEIKDKTTGKKTYYLYPHSRGWQRVPTVQELASLCTLIPLDPGILAVVETSKGCFDHLERL